MLNYTYLTTPTDLSTFGPNDLAKYRYVALFHLGQRADGIDERELALVFGGLAHFMRAECLVTTTADLTSASEKTYIKTIYHIFDNVEDMDAYVAIATVFPDKIDKHLLRPVYQELDWDRTNDARYPVYDALNRSLETLRHNVLYSSLEEIILPTPLSKQKELVSPFGARIKSLREDRGSQNVVAQEHAPGRDRPLGRSTLRLAEEYESISREKLQEFADYFGEDISYISLEVVVPNKTVLKDLREESGLGKEKLAHTMGIACGSFFDLLESADSVSTKVMRFVHKQYKNILNREDSELKFDTLLDLQATVALEFDEK